MLQSTRVKECESVSLQHKKRSTGEKTRRMEMKNRERRRKNKIKYKAHEPTRHSVRQPPILNSPFFSYYLTPQYKILRAQLRHSPRAVHDARRRYLRRGPSTFAWVFLMSLECWAWPITPITLD